MEKTEKVILAMMAMQRHPWEQGVCAQSLYELGREELWVPMAYDMVKRQTKDGRLAMVGGGSEVTDPASAGAVCFRAWQRTGEPLYLEAAQRMLDYLMKDAPRTAGGVLCHVIPQEGSASRQVWVDSMFMAPPFLALMGEKAEALRQLNGMADYLRDPETGLLYHIYDAGERRFLRKKLWATGNGWALMGMAAVRSEIRGTMPEEAARLEDELRRLTAAMLRHQRSDGRFHDVLDDRDTFVDGTSGLMLAACVFRCAAEGMLTDPQILRKAEAAYQAAAARIDAMGLLRDVCGCPSFDRPGTSAEAQAAFLMASAWRERCAQ